jgi:hypothetical protein
MKKSIFAIILTVILVSFNSNYRTKSDQLNELLLQNIECLSSPEETYPNCWGLGSVDCPTSKLKVYYYSYY